MKKVYQNAAPGAIPVYADSARSQQIGKLFARSSCLCIGEQDGLAIVLYKVKVGIPEAFKVGFVDAAPAALTPQPSNGPVSPAF